MHYSKIETGQIAGIPMMEEKNNEKIATVTGKSILPDEDDFDYDYDPLSDEYMGCT